MQTNEMSIRTYEIYRAALAMAHGEIIACPEPNDATPVEQTLLTARECFAAGRQCRGWDLVESVCPEDHPPSGAL